MSVICKIFGHKKELATNGDEMWLACPRCPDTWDVPPDREEEAYEILRGIDFDWPMSLEEKRARYETLYSWATLLCGAFLFGSLFLSFFLSEAIYFLYGYPIAFILLIISTHLKSLVRNVYSMPERKK